MDSNTLFISLIYYVGICSCAAQGAEKGTHDSNIPVLRYIANAFGGGFIRDIVFLGVYPWLFTLSALPDIILVLITGFLYTYYFFICKTYKKQYGIVKRLVTIIDALGLGSFICIGMDKAFTYSSNGFIIIVCGYVTAVGGGILASGKSLTKIFENREMVRYHIVTLLGCSYYYVFRNSLFLVYVIAIGIFLINIDYRIFCIPFSYNLIILCLDIFLLYPAIHHNNNSFQRHSFTKIIKRFDTCSESPKIYLIQRRIRQC